MPRRSSVVKAVLTGLFLLSASHAARACDVESFLAKVHYISKPFSYTAVYDQYRPPEATSTAVPDKVRRSLHAVFDIAPVFFQARLCELSGIWLDDSNLSPWGYRENPRQFAFNLQPAEYGRYIAMPSFDFIGYRDYETALNRFLLSGWHGADITRMTGDADNKTMMGLAQLAHEDGHILFRQLFAPHHEPISPMRFCNGQFFAGSWSNPVELTPVKGVATYTADHHDDPQIRDLIGKVDKKDFGSATEMLDRLFQSGQWISLLAAFTPEHDFVETYKFVVLSQAKTPLHSMIVTLPDGKSFDLMADLTKHTEIARKAGCFNWMRD